MARPRTELDPPGRWQVLTMFHDGAVRIRCEHRSERWAEFCVMLRRDWKWIRDPHGAYHYDLRWNPR
jgi:hypothetical protein